MNKKQLKELCKKKGVEYMSLYSSAWPIIDGKACYPDNAIISKLEKMDDYKEPELFPEDAIDLRQLSQAERDAKVVEMMKK